MTVTYSADVWDGKSTHDTLAETVAADEADAIRKSREWAKAQTSFPARAWLRVKIDGVIRSVSFHEIR